MADIEQECEGGTLSAAPSQRHLFFLANPWGSGVLACCGVFAMVFLAGCRETSVESVGVESPVTATEFNELTHDFGILRSSEAVFHTFQVENRSAKQWQIEKLTTSCDCAVPEISSHVILPGKQLR